LFTKGEDFKKINPTGKVPALTFKDSQVFESNSIMRWLNSHFQLDSTWYPKDPKQRALVEMVLDWNHNNTRYATFFVVTKVIAPK
jgi:glutathione S-transferase